MKNAIWVFAMSALIGCATEVNRFPAALEPIHSSSRAPTFKKSLEVVFDNGYSRVIPAGAQFVPIGKIVQGEVFKPSNTVFAVEGKHMHEAFIVVHEEKLVGFYLPVEKSFSPLSRPISVPF